MVFARLFLIFKQHDGKCGYVGWVETKPNSKVSSLFALIEVWMTHSLSVLHVDRKWSPCLCQRHSLQVVWRVACFISGLKSSDVRVSEDSVLIHPLDAGFLLIEMEKEAPPFPKDKPGKLHIKDTFSVIEERACSLKCQSLDWQKNRILGNLPQSLGNITGWTDLIPLHGNDDGILATGTIPKRATVLLKSGKCGLWVLPILPRENGLPAPPKQSWKCGPKAPRDQSNECGLWAPPEQLKEYKAYRFLWDSHCDAYGTQCRHRPDHIDSWYGTDSHQNIWMLAPSVDPPSVSKMQPKSVG